MNILIVWDRLSLSGGVLRFFRFGRTARAMGHDIVFLRLSSEPWYGGEIEFPMISLEEAGDRDWDATMIPGAGFSPHVIDRLAEFVRPNFGLRVQHVLNDPSRKPAFLRISAAVQPELLVFNNRRWGTDDVLGLRARRLHVLEGAVDSEMFRPVLCRQRSVDAFVVGGLANKNPAPLLEAVRLLGEPVQLWLYGPTDGLDRSASELERMGRLRVVGALVEPDLPGFYHSLDCVVHTETFAGWANLAAEALACGVPLICTPHGTLAFATHEITALVMREPTPGAIAAAITRLRTDSALARSLARNGRQVISRFSWWKYSESLVAMFDQKQD